MIRARKSKDHSFKEIKSKTTNISEMSINAIGAKMSKMMLKGKCYGSGSDHPKTGSDGLPDMQSATLV